MALQLDPPHILIVAGAFYRHIAAELINGATAGLKAAGATWDLIEVPGAFEIPAAIAHADRASHRPAGRTYNGYVALGCVIRGETTHYDYVCGESARALMNLTIDPGLAIGYGILTTGNAAAACLAMIALKRRLLTGA
jgi:6,7-dimethyl-8-ribityllumazine synthase